MPPPNASLPQFIVIGRMKSGTTTLGKWLSAQPDVFYSTVEEPSFFNLDENWDRGVGWYSRLFDAASEGQIRGEGTPSYTHPSHAGRAAERMAQLVPDVRLIYLIRHPIDRLRSEYRHHRMMGDETRTLIDALREGGDRYIGQSMYHRCLSPYIDAFPREQILVIRTDDLDAEGSGWASVLQHIGLPHRPVPDRTYNVSAERGMYPGVMRLRRSAELRRRLAWLPEGIRRLPGQVLRRRGADFDAMLERSREAIPPELVQEVWDDVAKLEAWLDGGPLWTRD